MVNLAGKFGPRYGKKIRWKYAEIEASKKKHLCPKCHMSFAKRIAKGIWYCKKCGTKFTGTAY